MNQEQQRAHFHSLVSTFNVAEEHLIGQLLIRAGYCTDNRICMAALWRREAHKMPDEFVPPADTIRWDEVEKRIAARLAATEFHTQQNIDELRQETAVRYYRAVQKNSCAIQKPMGYITRIAENVCKNFLNQKREEAKKQLSADGSPPSLQQRAGEDAEASLADLIPDDADPPETIVIRREEREHLHQAINQLPDPLRKVMWLFVDDVSPQDICAETGRALPTVYKDIRRGTEKLKALLSDRKE